MSEVISSFMSSSYVVSLCDFNTMSSGKRLQLLCIFPFGMLCLSAKLLLAVCIWWSERKWTLCLP